MKRKNLRIGGCLGWGLFDLDMSLFFVIPTVGEESILNPAFAIQVINFAELRFLLSSE